MSEDSPLIADFLVPHRMQDRRIKIKHFSFHKILRINSWQNGKHREFFGM
jgi:hypothetical protein